MALASVVLLPSALPGSARAVSAGQLELVSYGEEKRLLLVQANNMLCTGKPSCRTAVSKRSYEQGFKRSYSRLSLSAVPFAAVAQVPVIDGGSGGRVNNQSDVLCAPNRPRLAFQWKAGLCAAVSAEAGSIHVARL